MFHPDRLIEKCRVPPGSRVQLKDCDPTWAGDSDIPKRERKKQAKLALEESVAELAQLQELLFAADSWSVLLVFQAMDTAGKDGTIRHVMTGVNPQGCQVHSFKHPSAKELEHNFLWRYTKALPERGMIGIFNRSYYEEVLIVKVHRHILTAQRIPDAAPSDSFWADRYEDINNFERHLTRNGTLILKFFLHISKEQQRRRLLRRIDDPTRHWKFSTSDISERGHWDDYQSAYEEALSRTSTTWAPWYIIPADRKWVTRCLVAKIVTRSIGSLALRYPETTPESLQQISEAKQKLEHEAE
jgi:PPK2 family polyphosphate:nucleotide phosphotransferase